MTVWDAGRWRALEEIALALPGRRIVVIGALALAHHLGDRVRGTLDIDLAVALDVGEQRMRMPVGWTNDPLVPHRWRAMGGQLVDVVPASEALLCRGRVTWPDGTALDLTGIDLAMADTTALGAGLPDEVRVASLRALFVCKVAAWLDRPGDRLRDLGDIAAMLDGYVDELDPRSFDDPRIDPGREFDERPAFLLGADLAALIGPRHEQRIAEFVRRVGDAGTRDHALLLSRAPLGWGRERRAIARRLEALCAGLGR